MTTVIVFLAGMIIGFIVGGVSIANFLLEKEVDLHEAEPGRKRDNHPFILDLG